MDSAPLARGRGGFVALALVLYLASGLVSTLPQLRHADESFLARGGPVPGQASAGDHLQTGYRLWLVGHQFGRGAAPWLDPYSFQPAVDPRPNFEGWLFGLPYWPLDALFGAVGGWNVFIVLSYALVGGIACAWLRELGLPHGPALLGGLLFALAPYRVVQTAMGHLLGPISALLPLALLFVERRRRGSGLWSVGVALALAAIPLSGQLHLALGAIPLVVAYAFVRLPARRPRLEALGAAAVAILAGLLVREATVAGSIASQGRSLDDVELYSAGWSDLVSRSIDGAEKFVFLGWLVPVLALAGFLVLLAERRFGLAAVLAAAALVPIWLALGTNLPTYEWLWEALPTFRFPRVPERLMPIACLALAALAAVAVAGVRWRPAMLAVAILALADFRIEAYKLGAADEDNQAYAALAETGSGRLLDLPVFRPERHFGSVYLYYSREAPRERLGGYSTVAPRRADELAVALRPLNCGQRSAVDLAELGVRYVTLHRGVYSAAEIPSRCFLQAQRRLEATGFRHVTRDGEITLLSRP